MIILGIDPGTATTGYGVIEYDPHCGSAKKIKYVDCGCVFTEKTSSAGARLEKVYQGVTKLIKKFKPDVLAVERLFFFKNAKTAISVSQSRGIVVFTASKNKIPISEFTPLQVKIAATGYGRASKKQVQKMLKIILNLDKMPSPDDAADALAVALCHANTYNFKRLVSHS